MNAPNRINAWEYGGMRTWGTSAGPAMHQTVAYVRADIADAMLKVLQRIKRQTGIDARDWEDINAAIAKAEGDH